MNYRKVIRRNWKRRLDAVWDTATGAIMWLVDDKPVLITVARARRIYEQQTKNRFDSGATMYERTDTGEIEIECYGRQGIESIDLIFRLGGFPTVEVNSKVKADCDRMIAELEK